MAGTRRVAVCLDAQEEVLGGHAEGEQSGDPAFNEAFKPDKVRSPSCSLDPTVQLEQARERTGLGCVLTS